MRYSELITARNDKMQLSTYKLSIKYGNHESGFMLELNGFISGMPSASYACFCTNHLMDIPYWGNGSYIEATSLDGTETYRLPAKHSEELD